MGKYEASIIEQLNIVIKRYEEASQDKGPAMQRASEALQIEIATLMAATIERLAPSDTYYFTSFKIAIQHHGANNYSAIPTLLGIIKSLKIAYEGGFLQNVQELIHADLFLDFLEMAEYLLQEGFKDPAAMMLGGVLEEHLRKLCQKNSIETSINDRPKKAQGMNDDLAKSGVYSKLDLKSVTAWLDLRNEAAHAKYDEYTSEQVEIAVRGIRDFISRYPA